MCNWGGGGGGGRGGKTASLWTTSSKQNLNATIMPALSVTSK